jgi:DNA-binding helix-hairpin-helix protein with protein kinase domain
LTEHAKAIADCNQEKQKLHSDKREHQLRQFLSKFVIETSRIKDIGPARSATLWSWNIETAADVLPQRIVAVPGFGPKRMSVLLAWRKNVERRFTFNPNEAVSPTEIALVDQRYQRRRHDLESVMTAGVEQLGRTRSHDDEQARTCANEINNLVIEHAKLKSEARAYRWW